MTELHQLLRKSKQIHEQIYAKYEIRISPTDIREIEGWSTVTIDQIVEQYIYILKQKYERNK